MHERTFRFVRLLAYCLTMLLAAASAAAQEVVSASPDITIELGAGTVTTDQDVAVDNQLGVVLLENLGALPEASEIIALGLDVNGDRLISFETTTSLAGGVVARPGDVIRYDGASYSIEFDASAEGIPTGTMTDATSLAPGGLLLSFDTTVDLGGGLIVADEDLVRWNGSAFSLSFDSKTRNIFPILSENRIGGQAAGAFPILPKGSAFFGMTIWRLDSCPSFFVSFFVGRISNRFQISR